MINLDFPIGNKNIAILITGGIDSTILAYLLIKENKKLNSPHKIVPFSIKRQGISNEYSNPIIKYINKSLNTDISLPEILDHGELYHRTFLKAAIDQIFDEMHFDLLYIGVNKTPDVVLKGMEPIRKRFLNKNIKTPIFDLYKYQIISLYYEFGLEELLKITHSCTEVVNGRCKIEDRPILCWQCYEREWGFSKLGVADPGKT